MRHAGWRHVEFQFRSGPTTVSLIITCLEGLLLCRVDLIFRLVLGTGENGNWSNCEYSAATKLKIGDYLMDHLILSEERLNSYSLGVFGCFSLDDANDEAAL